MKVKILNQQNKAAGELELDDAVFGIEPRADILARVVTWQLAKRQAGTHAIKERGDVSGSTRKIYRQKGTGGARHGAIRGAQFRGGGIIFGPVVRDHSHSLTKKVRKLGLKMAIAAKLKSGDCLIVDDLKMAVGKTKEALKKFAYLNGASALFIDDHEVDQGVLSAIRNLNGLDVLPQIGANVYDILRKDKLVVTAAAIKTLEARLK